MNIGYKMILLIVAILVTGMHPGQLVAQETERNGYTHHIPDILSAMQNVQDATVETYSFTFDETPLNEALRTIANQGRLKILANSTLISDDVLITGEYQNVGLAEAFDLLLAEAGLDFIYSGNGYVIIIPRRVMEEEEEFFAQETITGRVTDAQTGEALPGVNVIVVGSEELTGSVIGAVTDVEGAYTLSVPEDLHILSFTYIGYQRLEVSIDGRTEIDIQLEQDIQMLDDLVVVGYGTQRRDDITGSVTQISGRVIQSQPSVQTSATLMGAIPGVQVQQNSGQPGVNTGTIRIRGIGTLGNSSPLILIDGVEGNLDHVSSSDIENITVLKDASAAAIYGSRAANGVVLVTTRRGSERGVQANYKTFAGILSATNQPEFSDAGTYMRLDNEGAINIGSQPVWSDSFIAAWEANHKSDPDNYPNTDWVNEYFSETAYQFSHSLNITGGSENIRYMGSITYDDESGEIPNFNFQRYNIRLNTDITASDRLSLGFDINAGRRDLTEPGFALDGDKAAVYRVPPIFAARYTHGGWGPGWNNDNPVAFVNDGGLRTVQRNIVRARITASYRPTESVEFNLMYAPDYQTRFAKRMRKQISISSPNSADEIIAVHPSINDLIQRQENRFSNNFNAVGKHQMRFADHNLRTMVGFEYIDATYNEFSASRDNFSLQEFDQLDAGSADNMQNTGYASEWAIASFFGRLNYSFKSRYLLEANVRYDGSSRFAQANRWGIFPSFSAGWMISEESFMQNIGFINSFKVRASWGRLGNQEIGNYPYSSVIDLGQPYVFGGSTVMGGGQLDLANENITWETTTSSNIGIDLAFLEDKVYVTFDYFERKTEDILLRLPIPRIIGLNPSFQNAGIVKNTGWEFDAGYSGFISNDFSYRVSFNVSDVKNEVVDLRGAGPFISGNSIIKEGFPINSIWGFESDGLFQRQSDIENHANQTGNIAPGDIRYIDQNGDGVINEDDRTIIGDPFPRLNFGINLSLNYKIFDLSALIQGVGKRDVLVQGYAIWPLRHGSKIRTWQAEDYWTPDNPNAYTPRLISQVTNHNNYQASDYYLYNGAYMRLRNLQVGFTLPNSLSERLSIRNARIFFLGQNLFTLTPRFRGNKGGLPPGIDPNVPNNTTGQFYPVTRMLSAGIDINF